MILLQTTHNLYYQHNISTEDFFSGNVTRGLTDVVYEVANLANTHLEMARDLKRAVKYPANVALLPAVRFFLKKNFTLL